MLNRIIILLFFAGLAAGFGSVERADAAPRPFQRSQQNESRDIFADFGVGYLYGNTTYRIDVNDPPSGQALSSELRFPLETFLYTIDGGYIVKDRQGRDQVIFSLRFQGNMGSSSGKLQDSDWLNDAADIIAVGAVNPGKDIFSESAVDLTARIADVRLAYLFRPADHVGVGPFVGYQYRFFDYTVSNLSQVGYGPYAAGYTGSISGKVLTYEVTYTIPYVGGQADMRVSGKIRLFADAGYSPIAVAKDRDDHVLRAKLGKGIARGQAYFATAGILWDLSDSDSIRLSGSYSGIWTRGLQTQYWYASMPNEPPAGTEMTGIADRINSQQASAEILISHRF
ncbi:MAG: omptin family outer membrane protease [Nitrospiraceae bacterium]|nr:omptin family outer membrane protease [Nitrospiraceae bacterium]